MAEWQKSVSELQEKEQNTYFYIINTIKHFEQRHAAHGIQKRDQKIGRRELEVEGRNSRDEIEIFQIDTYCSSS